MATSFLTCFRDIPEHGIAGMVSCPLDEMLLATLVGVLRGAGDFDDAGSIGRELEGRLRRCLPLLRRGAPVGAGGAGAQGLRERRSAGGDLHRRLQMCCLHCDGIAKCPLPEAALRGLF